MPSVIEVENLSKSYLVGHQSGNRERYASMREVIARGVRDVMRKTGDAIRGRQIVQGDEVEEFWALRDVSFQINPGEVVGVIGRNGAGKSTLLKVLSRITDPTKGRVTLRGRTASLLEVGTGFHPELSGRENIFLNGAILGMTKQEIRSKFDEIVAFAEIEKFLDTPVKRYSSGMYVRLAFAVAAHLEPEILIVDEVLAVGDASFQKKCLGKMQDVAKGGRTVLFVSHNITAVQALCSRSLLLQSGQLVASGNCPDVVALYLKQNEAVGAVKRTVQPNKEATLTSVAILDVHCEELTTILLSIEITSLKSMCCSLEVRIQDSYGQSIGLASCGLLGHDETVSVQCGVGEYLCKVVLPRMAKGQYALAIQIAIPMVAVVDAIQEMISFQVDPKPTAEFSRCLESTWGYGAFQFPMLLSRDNTNSKRHES